VLNFPTVSPSRNRFESIARAHSITITRHAHVTILLQDVINLLATRDVNLNGYNL